MEFLNVIYTTEGRLNRLRYFKYQLIWALVAAIGGFIIGFIMGFLTGQSEGTLFNIVTGIFSVVMGIGNIMLSIRRLHDLNKSGWFMLILLIPVVNLIFAIYMYLAKGTSGENRYGADPLEN